MRTKCYLAKIQFWTLSSSNGRWFIQRDDIARNSIRNWLINIHFTKAFRFGGSVSPSASYLLVVTCTMCIQLKIWRIRVTENPAMMMHVNQIFITVLRSECIYLKMRMIEWMNLSSNAHYYFERNWIFCAHITFFFYCKMLYSI